MYSYKTRGVCSSEIQFELENGIVTACKIIGGCRGNTQGVARLAENRSIEEVISLCKGIECRGATSCPDQLARALEAIVAQQNA